MWTWSTPLTFLDERTIIQRRRGWCYISNLCRGEDFGMLKCSTNSAWCNLISVIHDDFRYDCNDRHEVNTYGETVELDQGWFKWKFKPKDDGTLCIFGESHLRLSHAGKPVAWILQINLYQYQLCQSMSWWHHYCEEKSSTSTWWIAIIIISMLNLRHPLRSHGRPRWPSQESWLKSQIKLNKAWTKSLNFLVHIKCGWHIKIRHKSNFERKSFKKIVISQVSTISHVLEFLFKNVVWLLEVLVRWFLTLLPLWQVHGTGSLPPLFLRCI